MTSECSGFFSNFDIDVCLFSHNTSLHLEKYIWNKVFQSGKMFSAQVLVTLLFRVFDHVMTPTDMCS